MFINVCNVKVYPDDFGEFKIRARNMFGECEITCWVGEMPLGEDYLEEEEPDLPAWCNKVVFHTEHLKMLAGIFHLYSVHAA